MGKKAIPVSPFSTGGGGVRFELLVAVYYLIKLLRQEVARGVPEAIVQEVRLQQRNRGCPVDDIVLACKSATGSRVLYLQVKHSVTFSKNAEFIDVIQQAWRQMSGGSFHPNKDAVGLAIGEGCNNATVRTHVKDVLDWSSTSANAQSFYTKVGEFPAKKRVVEAFEEGVRAAVGKKPKQDEVLALLKHFVVVPFDFDLRSGRDTVDNSDCLIASVETHNSRDAGSLGTILYEMAAEYAPQAGEITRDMLSRRISAKTTFAVPVLQRVGHAISEVLLTRLRNRLAAEKNSKKYIPDVFVEIGDIKDRARLFCHPALFFRKVSSDIERLDLYDLNRFLQKVGLDPLAVRIPDGKLSWTYEALDQNVAVLRAALQALTASLADLKEEERSQLARRVPDDKKHVFDEVIWRIGSTAHSLNDYEIRDRLKDLDAAKARVFAVVSRAGQGKTNFVCDLAENCLAKRGIPCAYFTGKELSGVGRGQLQSFIARSIYGGHCPGTIDDLLSDIENEAHRRGTAGVILIDAINEHSDLSVFPQEVEDFIEKCLGFPRIRIILTCRSEYFDARFGSLLKSGFADQMIVEREIHQRMGEEHRRRLVDGYFRFFKISRPPMSDLVLRQFQDDPFLLRMFCEAYGNPAASRARPMNPLRDIRREALFREYFSHKLCALESRSSRKTGVLVGNRHPYQTLLRTMIDWMVEHDMYANVPVAIFDQNQTSVLEDLVDEDILVRRDLFPESVLGTQEVLNFTFDACRDFLLSDFLLNVLLPQDRARFEELAAQLTEPGKTVAEGLQEYLFYASRHLGDDTVMAFIERQPWHETVFLNCVFDLDETEITERDAAWLKEACTKGHYMGPQIAYHFLSRYDTSRCPHANIRTLFEMFDALDDEAFAAFCSKVFGTSYHGMRGGIYPIDTLEEHISRLLLSTGKDWRDAYSEIGKALLYLWNVPGQHYTYPARDLFRDFAKRHPTIASRLQKEHVAENHKGYQDKD
jgi:hypothetical protein